MAFASPLHCTSFLKSSSNCYSFLFPLWSSLRNTRSNLRCRLCLSCSFCCSFSFVLLKKGQSGQRAALWWSETQSLKRFKVAPIVCTFQPLLLFFYCFHTFFFCCGHSSSSSQGLTNQLYTFQHSVDKGNCRQVLQYKQEQCTSLNLSLLPPMTVLLRGNR